MYLRHGAARKIFHCLFKELLLYPKIVILSMIDKITVSVYVVFSENLTTHRTPLLSSIGLKSRTECPIFRNQLIFCYLVDTSHLETRMDSCRACVRKRFTVAF